MSVGKRLAEERKKLGYSRQDSFGEVIGVSFTTISRWEKGATSIPSDKLLSMRELGMDVDYILTGERQDDLVSRVVREQLQQYQQTATSNNLDKEELFEFVRQLAGLPSEDEMVETAAALAGIDINDVPGYPSTKSPTSVSGQKTEPYKNNNLEKKKADVGDFSPENFAMIPLYNIKVSAGNGRFADSGNIKRYEPFSRGELIRRGYNEDLLACVQVHGDSMTPALSEGDVIMIDMSQRDPLGAIYVLRAGDAYYVKRLVKEADKLVVISDNKELYREWTLQKGDDFEVIGKMVEYQRWL